MNSFLLKEICFFLQLLAITNPMNRMGRVEYMEDLDRRIAEDKNKSIKKLAKLSSKSASKSSSKSSSSAKSGRVKCQTKKKMK